MSLKLTLEPTDKLTELHGDGEYVVARVWQGHDDQGTPVHAFIVRVAVHNDEPAETHARFAEALKLCAEPRPEVRAIPLRLII